MVPWSTYWDDNFFAAALPALQQFITNDYVRGAVSGIGVITICGGLAELAALFSSRRAAAAPEVNYE